MLLFGAVAGTLLALTFTGFYFAFEKVMRSQLDRTLTETAAPIIADLSADPDEKDVDQLDLVDQYFEVLSTSGQVLQRSKNLSSDLPLAGEAGFQTVQTRNTGRIRAAIIPFTAGDQSLFLVVGAPTRNVESALSRQAFCSRPQFSASTPATCLAGSIRLLVSFGSSCPTHRMNCGRRFRSSAERPNCSSHGRGVPPSTRARRESWIPN